MIYKKGGGGVYDYDYDVKYRPLTQNKHDGHDYFCRISFIAFSTNVGVSECQLTRAWKY